jgi:hypothetical protein
MFPGISDRWKIILQFAFILLLCAGVILLVFTLEKGRPSTGTQRVEFRVDASGGFAIITLTAGDASISEPTTVSVPWSKSLRITSGTEVYLTASNPTQTGNLSCTILLNQSSWKTDTTAAPKDGVACAGIVP